jgi:hypothetical protein
MIFWILFPKLGIWIQGSGAAGHVSASTCFSNQFGRQKKEGSRQI